MGVREDNFQQFLEDMAERNYQMAAKPVEIMAGLTDVCNLHCAFCPYCGFCVKNAGKKELPLEKLEQFSVYFPTSRFFNASLRGEPFLYSHFDQFIQLCKTGNVLGAMQLINNATQLHKYDLRKLAGVNVVSVSFDGADKKTFEALRCGADFHQVLCNMELLRTSLPDTTLQVTVVVCRLNLRQLADIYSAAREKRFNIITFNTVYGLQDDQVIQLLRLRESDRAELSRQMEEIARRNADHQLTVQNVTTFDGFEDNAPWDYDVVYSQLQTLRGIKPYLDYDEQTDSSQEDRRIHIERSNANTSISASWKNRLPYCTNPWLVFSLLPNGKVQPCCAGYASMGGLEENTVEEVWNGENFCKLRQAMFEWEMLPDYCRNCKVFMRYDYVNDFVNYLNLHGVPSEKIDIPPHYFPNREFIHDDIVWEKICAKHKSEEREMRKMEVIERGAKFGGINTAGYWEDRFRAGDWEKYGGSEQSVYFAQIALSAFPDWLKRAMNRHEWTVADWGCAGGEGTAALAREFPGCRFTGLDFSPAAVEIAREHFAFCNFKVADLSEDLEQNDVIFSSNTLEHFQDPGRVLKKLVSAARHHAVILLPLHDRLEIPEHFYCFGEDFFPLKIGGHVLSYFRMIDCCGTPLWPGEQLLLIYSAETALEPERRLSDLFSNEEYRRLKKDFEEFRNAAKREQDEAISCAAQADAELENQRKWAEKLTAELRQEKEKAQFLTDEKTAMEQTWKTLAGQSQQDAEKIDALKQRLLELQNEKLEAQQKQKVLMGQVEQALAEKKTLRSQMERVTAEMAGLQARNEQATAENAAIQALIKQNSAERAEMQMEIDQAAAERAALQAQLRARDQSIADALFQLRAMTGSRMIKLVHFLNRFLHQGFSHDRLERKKFRGWVFSRFRHVPDFDHRFHPLYTVIHPLEASGQAPAISSTPVKKTAGVLAEHLQAQSKLFDQVLNVPLSAEAKKLRAAMTERKYKGILIYPHVVFWEPLQTPQQILRAFAQEGWLCFFCESQYLENVCREAEPNLFITYEQDLLKAIGDTFVYVLITWMASLAFVDRIPNKTVWYHLLDHLEIFAYYDDYYRSLHDQTLATADLVSYVAGPLKDWTGDRTDTVYLPNGANVTEISNTHKGFIPEDMAPIVAAGHKIIGYYGYLAEWMDYDLVRRLAIKRPEWEFVFVGESIHDISMIQDLPNVHLLGRKLYQELPDYAKYFDVATIPFLVDEKMDCVSPIKFYEYLALGKPVVSSSMKELLPFAEKWNFIFCAKGVEEFLFYLDTALEPEIQAAAQENGPAIAARNSWTARVQQIEPLLLHKNMGMYSQPYTKTDVVVLAIIDYTFRHQRPQHFAQRLARNGHRVFYVNANFSNKYSEMLLEERLWQVVLSGADRGAIHLTDWADCPQILTAGLDQLMESHSIRDAVIVVDYPNWIHGALYLRKKYGFLIVTDYMDDFTGFLNPAESLVRENCQLLLRESNAVMASSQFLYDIAAGYHSRVVMNRNGTEFQYFHQAFHPIPQKKKRKIIGYYGAIAEWFDADVVCRCAERFPDCDLVLVGNVTGHRNRLKKYRNIRLPGEIPYTGLLPWLETFDVCLIPFDTSTELIKATNPVKFYEYLSAGKKIVATKIPELEPYSGRFAYLENDPEQFCDAVAKCLDGTDTLASPEECFAFAQENDWDMRAQVFEREALAVYPKISIVVVCYNQLDYTQKCVESILYLTAYPNFELILVDNCSGDGTAGYLREIASAHAHIKIVLNETNRGFAGGNNDGIAVSDGEYLVLLNNDTIVTRGWLTGLLKHFRNDPSVGMVGPVTNSIANEARIYAPYRIIGEMPAFADSYTFQHMGEEYPHRGILAMFCVMISRTLYEKAGPLDENYGIGMYEDDDYSAASERLGFRNVLAEDVFIHHFGSVTFQRMDDEKYRKLHQQNRQYFEKKWGVKWSQPKYRPGIR